MLWVRASRERLTPLTPELYAQYELGMSTLNTAHKRMGRPPVDSEELRVRMQRPDLDALDAWRNAQADSPGRPEAIRRLVRKGLDSTPDA